MNGGNLYEDVCAVSIFFNHSLKSPDLAFDATQTIQIGGFDLRVHGDGVFSGSRAWLFCFGSHALTIPPGGYKCKWAGYGSLLLAAAMAVATLAYILGFRTRRMKLQ
jgi:hypothetical protein